MATCRLLRKRAHILPGEEYYPPGSGAATRSRFLDITESPTPAAQPEAHSGTSFLGLDDSASPGLPLEDAAPPRRRHWLLWSLLLALLLVFGGLGYLEGRAQITHAFRGPVEIAQDGYEKLRQRITELRSPPTRSTETTDARDGRSVYARRAIWGPCTVRGSGRTDRQLRADPSAWARSRLCGNARAVTGNFSFCIADGDAPSPQSQQNPPAMPPAVDTKTPTGAKDETARG